MYEQKKKRKLVSSATSFSAEETQVLYLQCISGTTLYNGIVYSRNLKKAELQFKVVKDAFAHTKSIYDKVKAQVDAQPKDDGSLLEKRRELQREVDIAKRAFGQQASWLFFIQISKSFN